MQTAPPQPFQPLPTVSSVPLCLSSLDCFLYFSVFVLLQIRESEDEWGVPYAFTLAGQGQSVVVAARYELQTGHTFAASLCFYIL